VETSPRKVKVYYVDGQQVELWENPEFDFSWDEQGLDSLARSGKWELLFNALILSHGLTTPGLMIPMSP